MTLPQMLARNTLFADLHPDELQDLAARMHRVELKSRATVFRQGDAADHCYVVLSGLLKVVLVNEEGSETVLSLLGPGTTFGEIALLDRQPRSATVSCHERSELAWIDRQSFVSFLDQHPYVRDKLIVALCQRVRTLTERVEHLSVLDVAARLARTLLALADAHGTELQGRRYLTLKISQGELGGMVGASRESVNKLLRSWTDSGAIDIVDGRLQLLNPAALEHIAAPVLAQGMEES
ncbi:Crp/Fnr family transcriptional regulator [Chitinimonas sp.]|uniref:Crp/Fnr family transcriptional regulator n=1 Tax=Chitinimonas sp. TaxID=1934313 RepID=UPI0035AE2EF7